MVKILTGLDTIPALLNLVLNTSQWFSTNCCLVNVLSVLGGMLQKVIARLCLVVSEVCSSRNTNGCTMNER